ncbi:MAG: hypothetical protein IPK82_12955 [Polyangiaceae bacterium]|nr:hypothetical protein [Polyangiaceae bacterium]
MEVMVLIGVGYALYNTVYVHVIVDKGRAKPKPPTVIDSPAEPVITAMPMATVAPTSVPVTTAMPITTAVPIAHRYPNQTCTDDELDRLENIKKNLCKGGYAAVCGDPAKPKFARIPCSAIVLAIQQRQACRDARKVIQEKCFGGKPDPGHATAIEQEENGIRKCEALRLVNCAKGHPMAGK